MDYKILIIISAYLLDLIVGDPQWQWHPVRIIGRLTDQLENKLNMDRMNKKICGVILIILVVGITISCVWGALRLARFINPFFYYTVSILFIYFSLSIKALAVEANKVYNNLRSGNIQKAREGLSMIVGRDTKELDEPQIIRATVETIAESTMDGIIAPLFYTFLGGPILAWAYKAINTLDSMVGYRSERFIEFGKASARLDGLANFIPAKITMFLISLSSFCYRKDGLRATKWASRYFLKGPQDNSEATAAVVAGALGVQLGGLNFYCSLPVQKPFVGNNLYSLNNKHIKESVNLAYMSSVLFMIIGIGLLLIKGR